MGLLGNCCDDTMYVCNAKPRLGFDFTKKSDIMSFRNLVYTSEPYFIHLYHMFLFHFFKSTELNGLPFNIIRIPQVKLIICASCQQELLF